MGVTSIDKSNSAHNHVMSRSFCSQDDALVFISNLDVKLIVSLPTFENHQNS